MLYTRAAKYASYLTSEVLEDGSTNVWPAKSNPNTCSMTNIKSNQRCTCHKRVDVMLQCGHELIADEKFMLSKYSDRWLNTYCYYGIYPEIRLQTLV